MKKYFFFILFLFQTLLVVAQDVKTDSLSKKTVPGSFEDLLSRAADAVVKEDFQTAKALYTQAVALRPSDPSAIRMLYNVVNTIKSMEEIRLHNLDLKRKADINILLNQAQNEVMQKNYDSAKVHYTQVLALKPVKSQEDFVRQKLQVIEYAKQNANNLVAKTTSTATAPTPTNKVVSTPTNNRPVTTRPVEQPKKEVKVENPIAQQKQPEVKNQTEESKRKAQENENKRIAEENQKKLAAENETKRIAQENETKRLAQEAENKRVAQENENKRIALENERKLAQERENKRIAQESENKRIAGENEKKLAQERENKRIAQENESKRLASENEKKLAQEAENKRIAQENENKRLAQENEKKLAQERENKRVAQENESKRLALENEKKLAQEAENKRIAQENENKRLAQENEKRLAQEREDKRLAQETVSKRVAQENERKLAQETENKRLALERENKRIAQENEAKRLAATTNTTGTLGAGEQNNGDLKGTEVLTTTNELARKEKFNALIESAIKAINASDWEKALNLYNEVLTLNPTPVQQKAIYNELIVIKRNLDKAKPRSTGSSVARTGSSASNTQSGQKEGTASKSTTSKTLDVASAGVDAKKPGLVSNNSQPQTSTNALDEPIAIQSTDAPAEMDNNKENIEFSQKVLMQPASYNIADVNNDVKLTFQGISTNGRNTFFKFLVQNYSPNDFNIGTLQMTYIPNFGKLKKLNPRYISSSATTSKKEFPFVVVTENQPKIEPNEVFVFEMEDQLKKTKLTLNITGDKFLNRSL
ncbi:hypothetical protein [Segetibacter aerophilus]|uniref:Tetratricopeptide repeat protein n=1 Tax=Segetibacter aerophilus TaxID=670293 RepID=A0A512B742_9BACT|nr:hypothetical protein [Segetibacter aerophilus]GEO07776.1 hypothetical protein SAE01_02720 [Segetibacter aerophilus]